MAGKTRKVTTVTRVAARGKTPAQRARRRRNRQRRRARMGTTANNVTSMTMRRMNTNGAPTASSLVGRRTKRSGVFAPSRLFTSDLLDVVQMGVLPRTVVYNAQLSPQDLPDLSRGRIMARIFAKYRCLNATIRIESAVPTSAGGQYAAFFDPNPQNDWLKNDAVGALTSMPVQDVAAAWECLKLSIPPAELEREVELYTQDQGSERLVTRFGQLVILNMANSNVTPAGSAEVTVWLDATWEFYEPNASSDVPLSYVEIAGGEWVIATGGPITTPAQSPLFARSTAYRLVPGLPATFTSVAAEVSYLAISSDDVLFAFELEADAQYYAAHGGNVGKALPGASPTQTLSASIASPLPRLAVTRVWPFKAPRIEDLSI